VVKENADMTKYEATNGTYAKPVVTNLFKYKYLQTETYYQTAVAEKGSYTTLKLRKRSAHM